MKRILLSLFLFVLLYSAFTQEPEATDTLVRLKEVVILEDYTSAVPFRIETIPEKEIEISAVRDPGDFLRRIPNVAAIRKGGIGLDPVVRGFKYGQINVHVNHGMKIEGGCPNRMDPAIAHIDVDDITRMEVVKGPFALKYGPNMGGVINIKTWKPIKSEKFKINVKSIQGYESNWNGFKQHLAFYGGNSDVFFSLSGNFKKYGNYNDGNGETVNSHFTRYNYSAVLGFSPLKGHEAILSLDESYGRDVMYPALPMDERVDDTQLLSFDYTIAKIGKAISGVRLKVYHSAVHHEMDNKERPFSDTVVAVSIVDATNTGYRLLGTVKAGSGSLTVGTDHENIRKDGTRTKTKILEPTMPTMKEDLWNDAVIDNYGLFAEYQHTLGRIDVIASIRADFNEARSGDLILKKMENIVYSNTETSSEYFNLSASAGINWHVSGHWLAGFSLGRGVRSPDMIERFIILLPVGYDSYDYLGNPSLKPEANNEVDLSTTFSGEKYGTLGAGVFFSVVTDYITGRYVPPTVAKPQTAGVLGVKQFVNLPVVYLWGWELSYASPARYRWRLGLDVARTCGINPEADVYVFSGGNLQEIKKVKNDPLPEIPPLEANLSIAYSFLKGKVIPEANVRAAARQDKASEAYGERKSPGFIIAGLRIVWNYNQYLTVTGGIENLFDKAYYEHLNRRITGSSLNFYEPGRSFYVNLIFNI
ncbi:MAG: TonB-dependent receptor [Bacteroidetes bacterium]|nr:TonB-dependent receptor [Bacteroidota bacterium]